MTIEEAQALQNEIRTGERIIGVTSLCMAPLYRQMQYQRGYLPLGYKTFEGWIDAEGIHHGRSRVYDLIYVYTQLEGSFDADQITKMVFNNADLIVEAFQDNVPERFRTSELIAAAGELSNARFRLYLESLMPGLHLEERHAKTFQLSPSQHGIVAHAINKVKKDTGAKTDAEAVECMAQSVVFDGVREIPLDPALALIRKVEAVELDRGLCKREGPTAEQWKEIVKLTAVMESSLLDAAKVE